MICIKLTSLIWGPVIHNYSVNNVKKLEVAKECGMK